MAHFLFLLLLEIETALMASTLIDLRGVNPPTPHRTKVIGGRFCDEELYSVSERKILTVAEKSSACVRSQPASRQRQQWGSLCNECRPRSPASAFATCIACVLYSYS